MDDTLKRYIDGERCNIRDAAELLGCSRDEVERKIHAGILIGWRPGKRKYALYRRQVEELAARQQSEAIKRARLLQSEFVFDY